MRSSLTRYTVVLLVSCFFLPVTLIGSDLDTVTVSITVNSVDTVVVQGDTLDFESYLINHTADTLVVDGWFTGTPDSGNEVLIPPVALCIDNNPLEDITLLPYDTLGGNCWLWMHASQDTGGYTFTGKVGYYYSIDSLVIDEDSFHFWVIED